MTVCASAPMRQRPQKPRSHRCPPQAAPTPRPEADEGEADERVTTLAERVTTLALLTEEMYEERYNEWNEWCAAQRQFDAEQRAKEIAVALRPGMVADAIVAALDEAIPWWRHPCPPEFLAQGKDSRAYKAGGL